MQIRGRETSQALDVAKEFNLTDSQNPRIYLVSFILLYCECQSVNLLFFFLLPHDIGVRCIIALWITCHRLSLFIVLWCFFWKITFEASDHFENCACACGFLICDYVLFFCSSRSLKLFHTECKFENRSLGSEQDEGKLAALLDLPLNMHEGHLWCCQPAPWSEVCSDFRHCHSP